MFPIYLRPAYNGNAMFFVLTWLALQSEFLV
jgi:hypothetical protein